MPNYFIAKLAKILKIWRICRDDLLSTLFPLPLWHIDEKRQEKG